MTSDADFIHMGALTVNLATYQVKVNGEPIDLTFMEYALLSFWSRIRGEFTRARCCSPRCGASIGGSRTVDACAPPARQARPRGCPAHRNRARRWLFVAELNAQGPFACNEEKDQPEGWSFLV